MSEAPDNWPSTTVNIGTGTVTVVQDGAEVYSASGPDPWHAAAKFFARQVSVPDPWRDAAVAAMKAYGRYFEHAMSTQTPEQLLADLLRSAGSDAAAPSRQRLRDLASIADQMVHCARSIADALQPAERWDVVMADAGPAIAPDTVPVIKAWAEGAAVQSRYRCFPGISNPDEWRDCARPGEQCIPNWMHQFMEYRVKP